MRMLLYLDIYLNRNAYYIVRSKHGKAMEYLSSYLVECIFVVFLLGDFQILLYQ